MPMTTWFKDWFNSPYYHKLYAHRDDTEAGNFINKLLDHLKPGLNCTMLDVGCGKGRHSIELASKGYDVTGIDLSEESIFVASQYANERLHFFVHDMRLPFRSNYFDFAFSFFTSFGYFKSQQENDDSIKTIAESLKENGVFVMDYLNVRYAEDHFASGGVKQIEDVKYTITKWHDETHFYKKIMVEDAKNNQPLEFTEKVAKFSLADFTEMLRRQGLTIKEVMGDYSLNTYDALASPRLIIVAGK